MFTERDFSPLHIKTPKRERVFNSFPFFYFEVVHKMSRIVPAHITPWELLHKSLPDSVLDEFEFGMPLFLKGKDDVSGRRIIQGVASTPDKDLQDEYVIQKGLDLRYFLKHGFYNDDHKPGFENKVGQPTLAVIKKVKDKNGKNVLGLWNKGYLWVKGSHEGADHIWELGQALEASGSDRQLGFSIQGKVLTREGSRIIKAWVQDIAITPSPVNTATWMELVHDIGKGLNVATRDVEDIQKGLSSINWENVEIVGEPEMSTSSYISDNIESICKRFQKAGHSATESRNRALATAVHALLGR